jgi:arabinose-5-phosphate isomerase
MTSPEILQLACSTITLQAQSVQQLSSTITNSFADVVHAIHNCKGRLIIAGIGKSAIVAQKIVATCNSTGTPSLYMHAADAIHGDLGMVQPNDCIIIISKSGESAEIKLLVQLVKEFGNTTIALCGNAQSYLVQQCNYFIDATVAQEACPNNLAPTTSTTAQMVMGDALAICLLQMKNFKATDFARVHPGGALGKQLYTRVKDISTHNAKPIVQATDDIKKVIVTISTHRLGATAVLLNENLVGIVTDGDLRRMMETNDNFVALHAKDIMTLNPKTIDENEMAVSALAIMKAHNIFQLVVTNNNNFAGFIHLHDLIKEGLV